MPFQSKHTLHIVQINENIMYIAGTIKPHNASRLFILLKPLNAIKSTIDSNGTIKCKHNCWNVVSCTSLLTGVNKVEINDKPVIVVQTTVEKCASEIHFLYKFTFVTF